jgi:archaellum component FlaC
MKVKLHKINRRVKAIEKRLAGIENQLSSLLYYIAGEGADVNERRNSINMLGHRTIAGLEKIYDFLETIKSAQMERQTLAGSSLGKTDQHGQKARFRTSGSKKAQPAPRISHSSAGKP